jgi:hypothetical protein
MDNMELSGKTNINPKIWGPFFWKTFHLSTFGYPQEPNDLDKKTYKLFYETFMKVLPCDKCSINSQKISIEDLTEGLESRDALVKWGFNFHNKVNTKIKVDVLKFETFMADMELLISGKNYTYTHNYNYIYMYIFITLLILVLIYLFIKHYT